MSCVCLSAACHLLVEVENYQGGELLATVAMKAASHEWVTGSLLWPHSSRKPKHVPIPTSWVNSTGRMIVKVSVTFESVNMSAATTWDGRRHPAFNTTAHPERSLFNREIDLTSCQDHRQLVAPEPCGFIDGESPEGYWSLTPNREWVPGCSDYLQERDLSVGRFKGSRVLLLGDSQMRTLFEAMLLLACPAWPYMDYRSDNKTRTSICRTSQPSQNASRARNICGGRMVVHGDGCHSGGAEWSGGEVGVTYADMHAASDFRFVGWPFVNAPRFDVVLVGNGLHNQNSDGATSGSLARGMFARLRRVFPSAALINVGVWASDSTKRHAGYAWAAALVKNDGLSRTFADAAREQSVRSISLFRMSLPVRSLTPDGGAPRAPLDTLAEPLSLASVACAPPLQVRLLCCMCSSSAVAIPAERARALDVAQPCQHHRRVTRGAATPNKRSGEERARTIDLVSSCQLQAEGLNLYAVSQ